MLGSCVTSDDKCCIIFRPWTVTNVFWIVDKNKKKRQMKLRKSFSQSLPKTSGNHFFLLCGGKTLNREIGRKSWCHNGARDRKIVEVEKKMGFQNFTFHFYQRLPWKISFSTQLDSSQDTSKTKKKKIKNGKAQFPYLHHQPRCIVDELRRCRRASSRWTTVGVAYAFLCISTNPADVVGCLIDRAGVNYARTYHYYENSTRRVVSANYATLSDDAAACCRWYDCAYDVTSYMAVPGDPLMYTTRWGDIPVIRRTTLQLV